MMKYFLLAGLLSFGAQAQSDFTCIKDAKRTGHLYDIQKLEDSKDRLEVSMIVRFGNCNKGEFETERVTRSKQVSRIFKDGWNYPFQKRIATIETQEYGSEGEYKLTVSIDKARAFKKRSERQFGIHFRINKSRHKFIWEMKTKKNSDGSISIEFPRKKTFMSYSV